MIEYLGNNRAKLIVNISTPSGRKRKCKTITYEKKRDVPRMYQRFEDEVRHNPLIDTTVTELVSAYIKNRKVVGIKATTERGYRVAESRIKARFEGIKATDLTTYMIDEFIADMSQTLTPKTISNTISLLNSAYARAVKTQQLSHNPCEYASLPKRSKPEIKTFTEEDVIKFLKALENERLDYQVAYELCLLCGLRRSEVLGLKEEDINLPFKVISINKSRHWVDGKEIVQDTKTDKSRRNIAIPDIVAEHIEKLIEKHHAIQYDHTDWLIQDGFGQPIHPNVITNHITRIEKNNGLPTVSVHGLRHTFASMLNSEGIDIARISTELGHSNITTTLNIYTHVFNGASASSRGIADALNRKITRATSVPLSENKKTAEA